jgi:hypothetical protein
VLNSLARGFVGPATLVGHRGCCVCDGRAVYVGHRGCEALIQGDPPLVFLAGVLPVCVWCWSLVYAAPDSFVFALNLKSGAMVTGVTSHRRRVVASAMEVLGAGGTLQGATVVEVVDAGPHLGDSVGSSL